MSYGSYGDGGFFFLQPVDGGYGACPTGRGWHYSGPTRGPAGLFAGKKTAPTTKKSVAAWAKVTTPEGTVLSMRGDGAIRVDSAQITSFWYDYQGTLFDDPVSPLYQQLLREYEAAAAALDTPDPVEVIEVEEYYEPSFFEQYRLPLMIAGGAGVFYLGYRYFGG